MPDPASCTREMAGLLRRNDTPLLVGVQLYRDLPMTLIGVLVGSDARRAGFDPKWVQPKIGGTRLIGIQDRLVNARF